MCWPRRRTGGSRSTPVGECLRSGPGAALARGEVYYDAAAGLLDTVRQGGTAFEHVHGERFFDHLARHPDREAAFQGSMAARSDQEAHDVVAAYDFSGPASIVDVGGGRGVLLAAILRADPGTARRPDRPRGGDPRAPATIWTTLRSAIAPTASPPTSSRPSRPVPDAYMLSRVIHDWDDADARRILATCRRRDGPISRLLVIEAILPERAHDRPAAIRMDLHMLLLLGARERTEAEFRTLLDSSGFAVQRVVMTASPAGLGVIEAIPA